MLQKSLAVESETMSTEKFLILAIAVVYFLPRVLTVIDTTRP